MILLAFPCYIQDMLTIRAKLEDGSAEREPIIQKIRTIIGEDHPTDVDRFGFVNITAQVPRGRAEEVRRQIMALGILHVTISEERTDSHPS